MKRLMHGGALLLVLLSGYLFMLPATWFDSLLQRETRGSLGMTATSGTLWRGEGSLQALLPSGEAVTLEQTFWTVSPHNLLSLRLHVTLRSTRSGNPILDISLAPGEIRIHEAKLELPAALLGVLSPTLRAAALSGQLSLQVDDLRIGGDHAAGKGRVIWISAASDLSSVRPIGSYQLDIDGKVDGMEFRLITLGGALNLAGSGRLQPGKQTSYQITAIPIEANRQELAPLLRMLGREISPGTYQLKLDPNVRPVSG